MIVANSDSTSAAGTFFGGELRDPLVVGLIAVGIGTFTQALPTVVAFQIPRPGQQTNSGVTVELREPPPKIIAELRRLTGLTWEQLAQLLNVSRRSVHFWASGSRIASENRAHLQRVIETVRFIDRGSAAENRAALLAPTADGTTLLDELGAANYEAVVAALGRGRQRVASLAPHVSRADRLPRPPEEMVDASHERVHEEPGPARAGKGARMESGS